MSVFGYFQDSVSLFHYFHYRKTIATIPLTFLCSLQHLHLYIAMKICKLRTLKSLWTLKPPCRTFHGHPRLLVSDVHSQYESVRRGEQEIPKYFNFASDVLDKWSEIEKVGDLLGR